LYCHFPQIFIDEISFVRPLLILLEKENLRARRGGKIAIADPRSLKRQLGSCASHDSDVFRGEIPCAIVPVSAPGGVIRLAPGASFVYAAAFPALKL
jgi:hypothetical protein